jgi:long-chain acyl-CoA synthetase
LSGTEEELVRKPELRKLFNERIESDLKSTAPWEQVKKFILRPKPFTPEQGELTVSLKLKRDVIYQRHMADLESLYQEDVGVSA